MHFIKRLLMVFSFSRFCGSDFIGTHVAELSRATHQLPSLTSVGLYVSNLVHGVLNGVELEHVRNFFIFCSIAEISCHAKVQYADISKTYTFIPL